MSERPEIISRKSPNMSFSRDIAKLWKTSDFQQNLQTRAFHKIYLAAKKRDFQEISKHKPFTRPYKAVKKTPAIFKHISSKTRGFHEFKFLVSETPDTKSPNTSRFPRFYRERESFPYWCPNISVFCGLRMGLNRKIKQMKNSSQLVQFVLNRNLFVLVKWHIWNYTTVLSIF